MAFTERKIPYETLIRWHEDGRIGAHHVELNQVLKDGVVISSTASEPMQLATADFKGDVKLSDILGSATERALVQLDELNAENVKIKTQLSEMTNTLALTVEANDRAEQQFNEMNDQNAKLLALVGDRDDLAMRLDEMDQQNAKLLAELEAARARIEELTPEQGEPRATAEPEQEAEL